MYILGIGFNISALCMRLYREDGPINYSINDTGTSGTVYTVIGCNFFNIKLNSVKFRHGEVLYRAAM